MATSTCTRHFGHVDFDLGRVNDKNAGLCPVSGSNAKLERVAHGKSEYDFCPEHGLRLHTGTFVYWNGVGFEDMARLRNFSFQKDLAKTIALGSTAKAESHRLGHETSEDALSWNVFVALAEAKKLRETAHWLIGPSVTKEPELYLWGERIDLEGRVHGRYAPLDRVRDKLEEGIGRFKTEPDIMLVVPGEIVICIEAKFCSGNAIAHASHPKDGEKPTDVDGLLKRYLEPASPTTKAVINPSGIGDAFHSQLFRNVVFASEMAGDADWRVVNLVSETQWKRGAESSEYSFKDPRPGVRAFLAEPSKSRFKFRTWEGLYAELVKPDTRMERLGEYLSTKSAHYKRAFELA